MKPLYLIGLLCLASAAATAQKTEQYTAGRWLAKLNLLSMLDPQAPTIQPGVEYCISNAWSVEFSAGIPTRIYQNIKTTDSTYYRYYKLKLEFRYFPGGQRNVYVGPELGFMKREQNDYDGVYAGKDQDYSYTYAQFDKTVVTAVAKVGVIVPLKKNSRWLLDGFVGAGPRFVHLQVDALDKKPEPFYRWLFWNSFREGNVTTLHITTGLKLCYIFH